MLATQEQRLGRSGLIKAEIFSGAITLPVDNLGSLFRDAGMGATGGNSIPENGHFDAAERFYQKVIKAYFKS